MFGIAEQVLYLGLLIHPQLDPLKSHPTTAGRLMLLRAITKVESKEDERDMYLLSDTTHLLFYWVNQPGLGIPADN